MARRESDLQYDPNMDGLMLRLSRVVAEQYLGVMVTPVPDSRAVAEALANYVASEAVRALRPREAGQGSERVLLEGAHAGHPGHEGHAGLDGHAGHQHHAEASAAPTTTTTAAPTTPATTAAAATTTALSANGTAAPKVNCTCKCEQYEVKIDLQVVTSETWRTVVATYLHASFVARRLTSPTCW